jgi:hypothetical protein
VNLTSQGFDIPICGENGASGSTVTTYEPINLCVSQGDYVDFNDEGGYVPLIYRSGVPYEVIAPARGSTMDSFIKPNATNNGDTLSSSERSAGEGFASNENEELMLQVILGTGPDATHICPGGTGGTAPPLPAIRISKQTDGLNRARRVSVAVFCRSQPACVGTATLTYAHKTIASANIRLAPMTTSHVPMQLTPKLARLIRRVRAIRPTFTVVVGGQTFTQNIVVRVF